MTASRFRGVSPMFPFLGRVRRADAARLGRSCEGPGGVEPRRSRLTAFGGATSKPFGGVAITRCVRDLTGAKPRAGRRRKTLILRHGKPSAAIRAGHQDA